MRGSRAINGGFPWWRASAVLLSVLLLTGCASAVAFRIPQAGPETTCVTPAPAREMLVGVALLWRQLLSFRWLNSSLAARSLARS